MKPSILVILVSLTILIGCGGGGGGGSTTGSTNGNTNGNSTGTVGGDKARVSGLVLIDGFSTPIPGVRVQLVNSAGSVAATVTTNDAGKYSADVLPIEVAKVIVDKTSISNAIFYGTYAQGGIFYSVNSAGCGAPVSGLSLGQETPLPTIYFTSRSEPPPPPPAGCQ